MVEGRQRSLRVRPGSADGFSLIEVMIAILILGIAVVGLTQGITVALGSNKDSELQTTAALYAAGRIEMLRAEGWLIEGETEGECGSALPLYRWKETIAAAGLEGLYEVAVVVEHTQTGQEIYELRTLLFEKPISATDPERDERANQRGGRAR